MDWQTIIETIKRHEEISDYTLADRLNRKSTILKWKPVTQNKIFRWRNGISAPGYYEGKRIERIWRDLPESVRKGENDDSTLGE